MWPSGLNTPVAWISPHLLWNYSPQVSLMAFQFYSLPRSHWAERLPRVDWAFLQQGQLMGVGQQHVSEQGWIVQALRRWSYFSRSWVGLLHSWWLALAGCLTCQAQLCYGSLFGVSLLGRIDSKFTSNDSIRTSIWRKQPICKYVVCISSRW